MFSGVGHPGMRGSDCERGWLWARLPLSVLWFEHTRLFQRTALREVAVPGMGLGPGLSLYLFLFDGWRTRSLSWDGEAPDSAETS